MRIEVEKQIDAETKEVWSFDMFDLNAVFVAWRREKKQKDNYKWVIEEFRSESIDEETVLSEIIRNEALSKIMEHIRIYTLSEWKAKFQFTHGSKK